MNIVRALRDWSKRSHLTSSVFQLTALRDKLNETLAEATRLALSPPKEDVPISNWPQKCFCTSTGGHALGKPKYLDITLRSADNGVVARYFKRPSIGTVTTLRIALFNQTSWRNNWSVGVTATDCSRGSILSLAPGQRVCSQDDMAEAGHRVCQPSYSVGSGRPPPYHEHQFQSYP